MSDKSRSEDPEALLARAKAGDREAVGRLLETYRKYLMLLARVQLDRRLGGKAGASDIVQETCLAAHCSLASFRGTTERQFLAWLRQILSSKLAKLQERFLQTQARDVHQERRMEDELTKTSELACNLVAKESSPSRSAVRREQAVILANSLDQLPPNYRDVIVLHQLEGRPLAEVAQKMGRSLDSVKKLWVRALGNLERLLEDQFDGGN